MYNLLGITNKKLVVYECITVDLRVVWNVLSLSEGIENFFSTNFYFFYTAHRCLEYLILSIIIFDWPIRH